MQIICKRLLLYFVMFWVVMLCFYALININETDKMLNLKKVEKCCLRLLRFA